MLVKQQGFSVWNAMAWVLLGVVSLIIGAKAVPAYSEFMAVKKSIKAIVAEESDYSVANVAAAFDRKATIAYIETIKGKDLKVTDMGGGIVKIEANYTKEIELVANAFLLLKFDAAESNDKAVQSQ